MTFSIWLTGARSHRPWNPARSYLVLLALPVAALLVLFIWPLAMLVARSITDPSFGLANYRDVFSHSAYLKVLLYTLQVGASVTALCLVMSYPVAVAMSLARGRLLSLLLAMVLIPFWTSAVIRTYSWMILFQNKGVLNSFLIATGVISKPLALMNNSIGVHIGMVHVLMPFMILPLLSSLRSIDPNYMRAAGLLGASPIKAFFHVFLPLSMPGISAGCALVFITALGFYITPALLGGMSNVMIAVLIDQQVNMAVNWGVASALATLLLILTSVLYIVYERLLRRAGGGGIFE